MLANVNVWKLITSMKQIPGIFVKGTIGESSNVSKITNFVKYVCKT